MKTYWTQLKNGELRQSERIPKKVHVLEETLGTVIEKGCTGLHHMFTTSDGNTFRDYTSFCGYDRGPKKFTIIKKMLTTI
jgi:hypothetical protein